MKRLIAAILLVLVLSGCDFRQWPRRVELPWQPQPCLNCLRPADAKP